MLQRGQERKRKCWSQQRLNDEAGEEETQKKRFITYSRSVKATETTHVSPKPAISEHTQNSDVSSSGL
ncbi:hypothetical protein KOW79_014447 [Hemibagrus wyckioides]|uniref:Uncharacterized protein n=1 Tax=Hemibagrus wyckioides TaxID=337641 RepID=A0A9D3SJN9_9TELE|nr:hypothetical protein KOW79_014447 [Hemibagrus wyckioides]